MHFFVRISFKQCEKYQLSTWLPSPASKEINIKKSRHLGWNYAFFYDNAMSLKSDHVPPKKGRKSQREQRWQWWYIAPVFANYSEETLLFNEDHIVNAVILTRIYVHRKSSVKDFIKELSQDRRGFPKHKINISSCSANSVWPHSNTLRGTLSPNASFKGYYC